MLGPPAPPVDHPVLWRDWPRCHFRRNWLRVVRSQSIEVTIDTTSEPDQGPPPAPPMLTRSQRAHWRLTWTQRLARNARSVTSPSITITLHGFPASFAQTYGLDLLQVA
jgi:hypothetical protein